MTPYQVVIEGVFVEVPNFGALCGFHTTFYIEANNATNAVIRAGHALAQRLERHNVVPRSDGSFTTYYVVRDIWHVTDSKLQESNARDLGFSFFSIGRLEKYFLALRHALVKRFKPWTLLPQLAGPS